MSMEAIRNLSVRTIRARLMTPPGGRKSSELEVIPVHLARAIKAEEDERRKGLLRKARHAYSRDVLRKFALMLEDWIATADATAQAPIAPLIPRVTVMQIIEAASDYCSVPIIHILSARRTAEFVRPRRLVMYLAREHTECSLPMIGARLGGRDHTTCLTGYQEIAKLVRENDPKTINDIAALRAMLGVE